MIVPARPEWAALLTQLALRSKASWGYDDAFMERVSTELRVTEDDIRARPVYVWFEDDRPLGFYALLPDPPEVELDLFFIEPEARRRGIGHRLFKHAVVESARNGWKTMMIQSDPFAEPFYLSCGAVRVGHTRSPSTGRSLPMLRYEVPALKSDADAVRTYLREIESEPVLTDDEIRELAKTIEDGRDAARKLEADDVQPEERRDLVSARQAGDAAMARLVKAHLRLVVSIARRYEDAAGGHLIDLVQEGNIGLIRAVEKFDWRRGFKFATYATYWVRQAIQQALRSQSGP